MSCPPARRNVLRGVGGLGITTLSGCLFGTGGRDAGFDLSLDSAGADLRAAFTRDRSELSPEQMEIVEGLRESDTTVRYDRPPFDRGEILHLDGSYYRVSVVDDGAKTIRRPVLEAGLIDESETDDEPVPLDRYDESAYEVVHPVVLTAHRGRMEPHVFYTEADRPEQLHSGPRHEYVTFQENIYRLEIAEQQIEVDRIEYEWVEFPTDGVTVEEAIRDQYEISDVDATGLSDDAQAILEEAIDDPPYVGTVPFSGTEEEILEALGSERRDVGADTRWIVFRGSHYRARVVWWHGD